MPLPMFSATSPAVNSQSPNNPGKLMGESVIALIAASLFLGQDAGHNIPLRCDVVPDEVHELSCFSCIEIEDNSCLETAVVDGKSKENIVGERIQGVYIVRDVKKEASIDNKDVYEFAFETALVIQIENRCYAFWRHLIFDRIFIKDCKNMEEVLRTIKSVEEIQEEAQVENPYIVTVERSIEEL